MEEHLQILGLITINGTDSLYVKYSCDELVDLIEYSQERRNIENLIVHGYGNIGGDEKVIMFPKNSVVSYMKC